MFYKIYGTHSEKTLFILFSSDSESSVADSGTSKAPGCLDSPPFTGQSITAAMRSNDYHTFKLTLWLMIVIGLLELL